MYLLVIRVEQSTSLETGRDQTVEPIARIGPTTALHRVQSKVEQQSSIVVGRIASRPSSQRFS